MIPAPVEFWGLNITRVGVNGSVLGRVDGGADAFVPGRVGQAWNVGNNVNAALHALTPPFSATTACTVSLWHKFTRNTAGETYATLFDLTSSAYKVRLHLEYDEMDWYLIAAYRAGYAYWRAAATANLFDDNWHHIALALSPTSGRLYSDGVFRGTSGAALAFTSTRLTVGRQWLGGANFPADVVDSVGWWNVTLSDAQIAELYAAGAGWEPAVADNTPNGFDFSDVTDADLSTAYVSDAQTISGMDAGTSISITGGEYRINAGTWTAAAGTIDPGQTLELRQTSSADPETATTATVTVGTLAVDWSVTTGAATSVVVNMIGDSPLTSRIFRSRIVQGVV